MRRPRLRRTSARRQLHRSHPAPLARVRPHTHIDLGLAETQPGHTRTRPQHLPLLRPARRGCCRPRRAHLNGRHRQPRQPRAHPRPHRRLPQAEDASRPPTCRRTAEGGGPLPPACSRARFVLLISIRTLHRGVANRSEHRPPAWGRCLSRQGEGVVPAAKKHSSVRARANRATTASSLTRSPRELVPDLPDGAWHPNARRWWADVWSSPMAPEWDPSDIHNVHVCLVLLQDLWVGETPKARRDAAAEFRLQRKDLGLTPYDRRRLEWTIESADEARDRGDARRSRRVAVRPAAPGTDDPRAVLRSVT